MRRTSIALVAAWFATSLATLAATGCGTQHPTSPGPTPAIIPAAPATIPAAPAAGSTPGQPTATADTLGAGPRHNAADVEFVTALIPHHRTGIALAAAAAAKNPQARTLAEAIIVTQQDEVVRMTGWLQTWSASMAASATPATAPADPISALLTHQEEAVTLAQQEQANGTNLTALAFAKQIIESRTAQTAELTTYRK
ncbi:DUF305 domain-containing protein [Paractinoplanes durhamensis]|uniref:DUF305 domain-containing protein n=1 Tax=Paractinoplanes durhamensis TaxID=113563 RepID=A0ABQ3YS98_9ACTN|nr:DUF305 domain-containing protein [Actinoplanes durhamensis]GIE00462.1 hypothetical protein Adu01nite_18120 [Actinoplanes durhamensis]